MAKRMKRKMSAIEALNALEAMAASSTEQAIAIALTLPVDEIERAMSPEVNSVTGMEEMREKMAEHLKEFYNEGDYPGGFATVTIGPWPK